MTTTQFPRSLGPYVANLLFETPTSTEAGRRVTDLIASLKLPPVQVPVPADVGSAPLAADISSIATQSSQVAAVELERVGRAIRRLKDLGVDAVAVQVLSQDAIRRAVEVIGWRALASLTSADGASLESIGGRMSETGALALELHRLLSGAGGPGRFARILSLANEADDQAPGVDSAGKAATAALSKGELMALADILSSQDPAFGSNVRERMVAGEGVESVRDMLFERLPDVGVQLHASAGPEQVFSLATNQRVEKDVSWSYKIKLLDIFDYNVVRRVKEGDGIVEKLIIDGTAELKARLRAAATDALSGEPLILGPEIDAFVDDLHVVVNAGVPAIDALLGRKLDMCFACTDGGSTPVAALWELPSSIVAELVAALSDPDTRALVADTAASERARQEARLKEIRGPIEELLSRYPGKPARHGRAHAALINLGLYVQQSVAEMGRDTGVVPRSEIILDPETLKQPRYQNAEHLKLRYLITDEGEVSVVSEEFFARFSAKYKFPPNHELVSYNRKLLGCGYLTVHRGRIEKVVDDTLKLKDKLPPGLPPALEILQARAFPLDLESILDESNERVIPWDAFAAAAKDKSNADVPTGTLDELRAALQAADHEDRAGLIARLLRGKLEEERRRGGNEDAARDRTAEYATQLLEGFEIIDVGQLHFRRGDLPPTMNDFADLHVSAALAPYLVRKVAQ